MLDQRSQLLRAAVGFAGCSMPSYDRALHALRTWLDSRSGIGHVAVGTYRQATTCLPEARDFGRQGARSWRPAGAGEGVAMAKARLEFLRSSRHRRPTTWS